MIRHGITASEVTIQTVNGAEFCGNWVPKSQSLFTYMVEKVYGAKHIRIPRGKPNVNADVETFHRIVEYHFFDLEKYSGQVDFLNKAYTYQIAFNCFRPNSYKWGKTPLKIMAESDAQIDPAVLSLPPIILDYHSMLYLRKLRPEANADRYQWCLSGGNDVPDFTVWKIIFLQILKFLRSFAGVTLVDPAEEAVSLAKKMLKKAGTLKTILSPAKYEYFVTGSVIQFQEIGSRLLGKPITKAKAVKLS